MDSLIIINKILRRIYLFSGIPILRERVKKSHLVLDKFLSFNLDRLKEPIFFKTSLSDLDNLKKRTRAVMQECLHIFAEPPIKLKPGVFLREPRTGRMHRSVSHWSRMRIKKEAGDEDIKLLWEINRLGDMDVLLASAIFEENPVYLKTAQNLVKKWRAENPFNRGLNWYSNMEVALRLLRFLVLRGILVAHQLDTDEVDKAIKEHFIHVNSEWRFTKHTMMGGNHLIVELAALAACEVLIQIPGKACEMLKKEVKRQFLPDGGYFEGSIGYHIYVLNVLLIVCWLAYSCDVDIPVPVAYIKKAMFFIELITGPHDTVPSIGDWDDGYILRPFKENPHCVRDLLNFARYMTDIPFKHNTSKTIHKWRILPESGMAVHKDRERGIMYFRAAAVTHGHSHLDMLSIHYLSHKGPIILDGGTFSYNYSTELRNFYRSPAAHSTLYLDDIMPLAHLGNFAWKGKLLCRLKCDDNIIVGEYDIKSTGTLHRKVKIMNNGYEIHDRCPKDSKAWSQYIVPIAEKREEGILVKNNQGQPALMIEVEKPERLIQIDQVMASNHYGKRKAVMAIRLPVYGELITTLRILS